MGGHEESVSWSDRPRGGWDEFAAAKARGTARGAEDAERARLEALWALPAHGTAPGRAEAERGDPWGLSGG